MNKTRDGIKVLAWMIVQAFLLTNILPAHALRTQPLVARDGSNRQLLHDLRNPGEVAHDGGNTISPIVSMEEVDTLIKKSPLTDADLEQMVLTLTSPADLDPIRDEIGTYLRWSPPDTIQRAFAIAKRLDGESRGPHHVALLSSRLRLLGTTEEEILSRRSAEETRARDGAARAIEAIMAEEVLDSRGNPTVRVIVRLEDGSIGSAQVPSGASTGTREALELRDGDQDRFKGRGVTKAVAHVNGAIAKALIGVVGVDATNQRALDKALIKLDGTVGKTNLGANAILGVSMASSRAAAHAEGLELFEYLGGKEARVLPMPMFNVLNGGAHANNDVENQEFMIMPISAESFAEALAMGTRVYEELWWLLVEGNYTTTDKSGNTILYKPTRADAKRTVITESMGARRIAEAIRANLESMIDPAFLGDEKGFKPNLASDEEALNLIVKAFRRAGYTPGKDLAIALDPAASEYYGQNVKTGKKTKAGRYHRRGQDFTSAEQVDYIADLVRTYPIVSVEDGIAEGDPDGWAEVTRRMGGQIQIVGDDVYVTNAGIYAEGIRKGMANSILVKLNQIGTVTETNEVMAMSQAAGYSTVISHRSGETEDPYIADYAVARNAGQIKTGAPFGFNIVGGPVAIDAKTPSGAERWAKFARLMDIEEMLGDRALFAPFALPRPRRGAATFAAVDKILAEGVSRTALASERDGGDREARLTKAEAAVRRPIIGGNWKTRKDITSEKAARVKAREFREKFENLPEDVNKNVVIVIFPEKKWVQAVADELKGSNIAVGVQSLFFDSEGDLKEQIDRAVRMGATFANVAHSMHRAAGLTNEQANKIMKALLEDGRLIPWYTIEETGEKEVEKEIGDAIDIGLAGIPKEVIATFPTTLEPTVLISTKSGTGVVDPNLQVSGEDAYRRSAFVREVFREKFGDVVAEEANVGYGASVKSSNAREIFSQRPVKNALVGGASLEAGEFYNLVVNAVKGASTIGRNDTKEVYDVIAPEYAKGWAAEHRDIEGYRKTFLELINQNKVEGAVLDAGTGTGRDAAWFTEQDRTAIGVDFSGGMLVEARKRHPNLPLTQMDLRHLGFRAGTLAGVWDNGTFHHLIQPEEVQEVLEEYHRVLQPNGILFLRVKRGDGVEVRSAPSHPNAVRTFQLYQEEKLGQLVTSHGFEVIESGAQPESVRGIEWVYLFARRAQDGGAKSLLAEVVESIAKELGEEAMDTALDLGFAFSKENGFAVAPAKALIRDLILRALERLQEVEEGSRPEVERLTKTLLRELLFRHSQTYRHPSLSSMPVAEDIYWSEIGSRKGQLTSPTRVVLSVSRLLDARFTPEDLSRLLEETKGILSFTAPDATLIRELVRRYGIPLAREVRERSVGRLEGLPATHDAVLLFTREDQIAFGVADKPLSLIPLENQKAFTVPLMRENADLLQEVYLGVSLASQFSSLRENRLELLDSTTKLLLAEVTEGFGKAGELITSEKVQGELAEARRIATVVLQGL